jgi:hypothetical protein
MLSSSSLGTEAARDLLIGDLGAAAGVIDGQFSFNTALIQPYGALKAP